jgi:FdhE protein
MLAVVLADARGGDLPAPAREAIRRLEEGGAALQEALADAILSGQVPADALASAPFVGAALQAYHGARTRGLDPAAIPPAHLGCPVCGSPPVASVVLGDDRLRYLSCSLCAAQWHLPRVHCATCRGSSGIAYFEVNEQPGARAEACEKCRAYVKLFDLEKRPGAEPLADDVATLALDLLMAEEGYARGGVNLLLWTAAG